MSALRLDLTSSRGEIRALAFRLAAQRDTSDLPKVLQHLARRARDYLEAKNNPFTLDLANSNLERAISRAMGARK